MTKLGMKAKLPNAKQCNIISKIERTYSIIIKNSRKTNEG